MLQAVKVFIDFSLVAVEENDEKMGQNWSNLVQRSWTSCEM